MCRNKAQVLKDLIIPGWVSLLGSQTSHFGKLHQDSSLFLLIGVAVTQFAFALAGLSVIHCNK